MAQESIAKTTAIRALQLELKKLLNEPVEGFRFKVDDANVFVWEVAIFGPPNTLYEGGYFKALMNFPVNYPYSPPSFRFLCKMFHPNIFKSGDVCISILHPPVDDPQSGEPTTEKWNPAQTVRTVLMSIISLLNEPNMYSPANVDASVAFRRWKEGKDKKYEERVRREVLETRADADRDGVTVPTTVEDYCITTGPTVTESRSEVGSCDSYYDDTEYICDDDDDYDDEDDSG